jgi:hypothetical protein
MGESSPSVESMGRGMAEVHELSPVQRFAIAPTTRIVARPSGGSMSVIA